MKKSICSSLFAFFVSLSGNVQAGCSGEFYNPITDLCWSCLFPMELMGKEVISWNQLDTMVGQIDWKSIDNCLVPGTCRCGEKCGIPLSFYEPARHYDITKTPGCFPGLGINVDMSSLPGGGRGMVTSKQGNGAYKTFNHVNVYVDPVLFWLDVIVDHPCLERRDFALLYSTPADFCWTKEAACAWMTPEKFLFGNRAAIDAAAADGLIQTAIQYIDAPTPGPLAYVAATTWSAGTNGMNNTLDGFNSYSAGGLPQDAMLLGQRMFTKLHREFLVWGTSGAAGLCSYYPKPLIEKLDYKVSMLFPSPQTEKIFNRCCQMFGVSTALWGSGKTWPYNGEDLSFMVFRRRDCCLGNVSISETILNAGS